MSGRTACGGFSLLESLVALVVLSIGLIGMAALQAQALAVNRSAQLTSQALDLAADMAERVRANRAGGAAYASGAAASACDGPHCTPASAAQHEVLGWLERVRASLPNGAGEVAYDAGVAPPEYAVRVWWQDGGHEPSLYELRVRVAGP